MSDKEENQISGIEVIKRINTNPNESISDLNIFPTIRIEQDDKRHNLENHIKQIGFHKCTFNTIVICRTKSLKIRFNSCNFKWIQSEHTDADSITFSECKIQYAHLRLVKKLRILSFTEVPKSESGLYWENKLGTLELETGSIDNVTIRQRFNKLKFLGGEYRRIRINGVQNTVWNNGIIRLDFRDHGLPRLKGNFFIENISTNIILIEGENTDSNIVFKDIKVNKYCLNNFINAAKFEIFNLMSVDGEKVNFTEFGFVRSYLRDARLFMVDFKSFKKIVVQDTSLIESTFVNCLWNPQNFVLNERGDKEKSRRELKETYRQLKLSAKNNSDRESELNFHAQEMEIYRNLIRNDNSIRGLSDRFILCISSFFGGYGKDIYKPFFWLMGWSCIFNGLFVLAGTYQFCLSLDCINQGIGLFFTHMNPIRWNSNYVGIEIAIDILNKVVSGFLIFNIIRASRKFIR